MNQVKANTESEQFLNSYRQTLASFSLPQRLSGQYEVSNCIRHSGNKEIYLLSDQKGGLYVLKKEKNNGTTQIRQEHQIFTELANSETVPAIPECIDYWEEPDYCYLLRTYIEGGSLAAYADKHPYLSNSQITDFSLEICRLIETLHGKKPPIIHRDIKPENFVLQKDTHILYLIDLDTARQYLPGKTRDTQLFGTPDLAAPEQFGFYQSDIRTDIYGIGKTMLYLMTGSTSEDGLRDKSFPPALKKIIRRAVAFSPEKRYPSITALRKDLQKYKKRISFSRIPRHWGIIGAALFFTGLFAGFTTGRLYPKNQAAAPETSVYGNEAVPDAQTAAQLQKIQDSPDSLLSISGAKQVDFWQYQNQVDRIILSYYNADYDTMITGLEVLVNDLYADDALMQVPGEDYSTYDSLPPDFWHISDLSTIRIRLAYRNQILRKNLGSYKDYQRNITDMLGSYLSYVNRDDTPSALYQYATLPAKERDTQYTFALSDILGAICSGFDLSDGFTPPM